MRSVRTTCALVCVGLATLVGGCSLATAVDRDLIEETPTEGVVQGSLGGYNNGYVFGWAWVTGQADAPVSVEITDGSGAVIGTGTADQFRQDLVDTGNHPTGDAGFRINVGDQPSGTVLHAYVGETELTNSPVTVP